MSAMLMKLVLDINNMKGSANAADSFYFGISIYYLDSDRTPFLTLSLEIWTFHSDQAPHILHVMGTLDLSQ